MIPATAKTAKLTALSAALTAAGAIPARAAPVFLTQNLPAGALAAGALALAVAAWSVIMVRKLNRDNARARQRIGELEHELSQTEALLSAEPHAMIVWEGREEKPARVSARLHLIPGVPRNGEDLARFGKWLDEKSVAALKEALKVLRGSGQAFNISVHTKAGELLEADGRAAGYNIVLRFRPVAGERLAAMEMVSDTRLLGEQVERLSALMDTAPMPVWLRDDDGRLLWANRAWLDAVEADDAAVAAAGETALFSPENVTVVKEDDGSGRRLLRGSTVIRGEKRIMDIHEVRQSVGVACWAVDITANEALRQELKSHIAAHTGTLDKLATAIAIFGQDRRLVFANRAYARLWGLDGEWLAERPLEDEILDRLRESRQLPERADFRQWKEEHLAIYTALEGSDTQWHLPDGRSLRILAEPHPQGGVIYLYEDITEKLRLESRYAELMGVQRETLDNLYEAVALFGTNGRLRLYNPAFASFWNLDKDFLDGHPHVDQIIARARALADDEAWWDNLKYCVTGMSQARQTVSARINLADERVFDSVIVPLPDGNTLATWFDMTDSAKAARALRERNEALMAADRLKSDFLSSISYEMRTPLTSIIGFAETMEYGIAGKLNEKQKEYVSDIHASATQLKSTIDTILDLTTIDAGQMELNIETLDVAELLENTARSLAARLERRDLTLKIELAADASRLEGDRRRLEQILSNLLSNAIGFSDSGGAISMGARRARDGIELWVADQGAGMDAETLGEAFKRFSARPSPGGHRGPGLGLPLVKSLVELHGGSVDIISRAGEGTTVICRFPFAAASSGAAGGRERRAEAS